MNDVEDRLRSALRATGSVTLHPDEADVSHRVQRHRQQRRRRRAIAATVTATVALVAVSLTVSIGHRGSSVGRPPLDTLGRVPIVRTTAASAPAPAPAPVLPLVVLARGEQLVDATGRVLATLPSGAELLGGDAGHLVVAERGRTYVYDTASWAGPIGVGTFAGTGVAVTDDGFWAADVPTSSDDTLSWRHRDWLGTPDGPPLGGAHDADHILVVGAIGDGLALWAKETGHLLVVTATGTTDLGPTTPLGTTGTRVAYVTDTDPRAVSVYDAGTGAVGLLARLPEGTAPAQRMGAGAFSPDGRWLTVALAHDDPAASPAGTLLIGDAGAETIVPVNGVSARWAPDGSAVVIGGGGSFAVIDPASPSTATVTAFPTGAGPSFAVVGRASPTTTTPTTTPAAAGTLRQAWLDGRTIHIDGAGKSTAVTTEYDLTDARLHTDGTHVVVVAGNLLVFDLATDELRDLGALPPGGDVVPDRERGLWWFQSGPTAGPSTWTLRDWDGRTVIGPIEVDTPAARTGIYVGATTAGVVVADAIGGGIYSITPTGTQSLATGRAVATDGRRRVVWWAGGAIVAGDGATTRTVAALDRSPSEYGGTISPDGRTLAVPLAAPGESYAFDTIAVVDLDTGARHDVPTAVGDGAHWSADGRDLVVTADRAIHLYDAVTGVDTVLPRRAGQVVVAG